VHTTGGILVSGSAEEEETVTASIDLKRSHYEKQLTQLSHAFGDRNPAVYDLLAVREPLSVAGKEPES
jgi:hypothetical protein